MAAGMNACMPWCANNTSDCNSSPTHSPIVPPTRNIPPCTPLDHREGRAIVKPSAALAFALREPSSIRNFKANSVLALHTCSSSWQIVHYVLEQPHVAHDRQESTERNWRQAQAHLDACSPAHKRTEFSCKHSMSGEYLQILHSAKTPVVGAPAKHST